MIEKLKSFLGTNVVIIMKRNDAPNIAIAGLLKKFLKEDIGGPLILLSIDSNYIYHISIEYIVDIYPLIEIPKIPKGYYVEGLRLGDLLSYGMRSIERFSGTVTFQRKPTLTIIDESGGKCLIATKTIIYISYRPFKKKAPWELYADALGGILCSPKPCAKCRKGKKNPRGFIKATCALFTKASIWKKLFHMKLL